MITTRLAGRFTPAARVGVANRIFIVPFLKASSTICLLFNPRPAWWNPTPFVTIFDSVLLSSVSSPCFKISTPIFCAESFEALSSNFGNTSYFFFASETARLRVSANTSFCPPSFVIEFIARLNIPPVELSATPILSISKVVPLLMVTLP